ncbi:hypothetical protein WJT74_06340 [Sphingomicrobium sp. XHP0239]|uniref:hypothetical protein n=1 Tax=Sphingomicrobium maritimum TaxID=3133972 RepID=UPI0031CCB6B2
MNKQISGHPSERKKNRSALSEQARETRERHRLASLERECVASDFAFIPDTYGLPGPEGMEAYFWDVYEGNFYGETDNLAASRRLFHPEFTDFRDLPLGYLNRWTLTIPDDYIPKGRDIEAQLTKLCRQMIHRGEAEDLIHEVIMGWSGTLNEDSAERLKRHVDNLVQMSKYRPDLYQDLVAGRLDRVLEALHKGEALDGLRSDVVEETLHRHSLLWGAHDLQVFIFFAFFSESPAFSVFEKNDMKLLPPASMLGTFSAQFELFNRLQAINEMSDEREKEIALAELEANLESKLPGVIQTGKFYEPYKTENDVERWKGEIQRLISCPTSPLSIALAPFSEDNFAPNFSQKWFGCPALEAAFVCLLRFMQMERDLRPNLRTLIKRGSCAFEIKPFSAKSLGRGSVQRCLSLMNLYRCHVASGMNHNGRGASLNAGDQTRRNAIRRLQRDKDRTPEEQEMRRRLKRANVHVYERLCLKVGDPVESVP